MDEMNTKYEHQANKRAKERKKSEQKCVRRRNHAHGFYAITMKALVCIHYTHAAPCLWSIARFDSGLNRQFGK